MILEQKKLDHPDVYQVTNGAVPVDPIHLQDKDTEPDTTIQYLQSA